MKLYCKLSEQTQGGPIVHLFEPTVSNSQVFTQVRSSNNDLTKLGFQIIESEHPALRISVKFGIFSRPKRQYNFDLSRNGASYEIRNRITSSWTNRELYELECGNTKFENDFIIPEVACICQKNDEEPSVYDSQLNLNIPVVWELGDGNTASLELVKQDNPGDNVYTVESKISIGGEQHGNSVPVTINWNLMQIDEVPPVRYEVGNDVYIWKCNPYKVLEYAPFVNKADFAHPFTIIYGTESKGGNFILSVVKVNDSYKLSAAINGQKSPRLFDLEESRHLLTLKKVQKVNFLDENGRKVLLTIH